MKEASYGVIPLQHHKGGWQVLLIQHGAGHWAFPKGHPESGEEPRETAARELQEETGLVAVRWLDLPPIVEHYFFRFQGKLISKTVTYYPAEVQGILKIDPSELADARWLSVDEAASHLTFKELAQHFQAFAEKLNTTR